MLFVIIMENRRDETETPIQIVDVYDDINNYEYSQLLEDNLETFRGKNRKQNF